MFDHSYKRPVHRDHVTLYVGKGHAVSILRVGDDTEVALLSDGVSLLDEDPPLWLLSEKVYSETCRLVPIREWLAVPSPEWNKETFIRLRDYFDEDDLVVDLLALEDIVPCRGNEAMLMANVLSLASRYVEQTVKEVG